MRADPYGSVRSRSAMRETRDDDEQTPPHAKLPVLLQRRWVDTKATRRLVRAQF